MNKGAFFHRFLLLCGFAFLSGCNDAVTIEDSQKSFEDFGLFYEDENKLYFNRKIVSGGQTVETGDFYYLEKQQSSLFKNSNKATEIFDAALNAVTPAQEKTEKIRYVKLKPLQLAYYRDLPTVRGYTNDDPGKIFLIEFIVTYDFNNRKLGLELSARRETIVDRARNLLMRYAAEDFSSGEEDTIKADILASVNRLLTTGDILAIYFKRMEVYDVP